MESPRGVLQKGVLRNFAKFTGKHLCLRPAALLKMRLWHRCFPVNFVKFLRTPFLQNTSRRLLLYGFSLSKLEKLSSESEELKEASLDNKQESLIVRRWSLKGIWILIIANLKTFFSCHKHLLFHLLHFVMSNYFNQILIFSNEKSHTRAKGVSHLTWN